MEKYVSQWYWGTDWLGNKCKNWYHGPRIDWMYLDKASKSHKKQSKVLKKLVKSAKRT